MPGHHEQATTPHLRAERAQEEVPARGLGAARRTAPAPRRTDLRHLPRGEHARRRRYRLHPIAQDVHRLERGPRQHRSGSRRNPAASLCARLPRKRIIGLLQEVFEATYTFDLGELSKKGLKDTARKLRFYKEGVNDYAVAWVIQRTLGGHAIPLDEPTLRVLTAPRRRRGCGPRQSGIGSRLDRARHPQDARRRVHRPAEHPCEGTLHRERPALFRLPPQVRVPRRHREHVQEARVEAEEIAVRPVLGHRWPRSCGRNIRASPFA